MTRYESHIEQRPSRCCALDGEGESSPRCPEPATTWFVRGIGLCDHHAVGWMRENHEVREALRDDGKGVT